MSIRGWLLALTLACLAGCGGRDARTAATSDPQAVSKPDPPPATTPAPGTSSSGWCTDPRPALGSSAGGIEGTGFGPVRRKLANIAVAGQMWDVSHAAVLINGQPATSAQIADGIITTVQGTLAATGAATAASVASESRVAGPITSIDATGDTLVVLGQSIAVSEDTPMPSPPALAAGDTVEVNALVTANGILVATRIERRAADLEYFITGTVSSHDDSAHTLMINALTVDYSGVVPQGFPTGAVHDGDLVRVFGHLAPGSMTLSARAVEFRTATPPGAVGAEFQLYGYITRLTSNADFDVNGVPITTTAATDLPPAPLYLDQVVVACGALDSNGKITAWEVDATWDY